MAMTKKDFVVVAKGVQTIIEEAVNQAGSINGKKFAEKMADQLKNTNPNFNRTRFIEACLYATLSERKAKK